MQNDVGAEMETDGSGLTVTVALPVEEPPGQPVASARDAMV